MGSGGGASPTPASSPQRPRARSLLPRPPRASGCAPAPATRGGGGGSIWRSSPRRAAGGAGPGGARGVGERGRGRRGRGGGRGRGREGRRGGACREGRAAAESLPRTLAGHRGSRSPRPRRTPGRGRGGGGGLKRAAPRQRGRSGSAFRPLQPAEARISACQVSVLASGGAAPGGRHGRNPTVGRVRPLQGRPLLRGVSPLRPFPRRGPGVSRGLTRSPGNTGPGCSIKMSFVERFPAPKLKCNQPSSRSREGSGKAGNGMTFFPWVRTHCEILPLCCLCSPTCL